MASSMSYSAYGGFVLFLASIGAPSMTVVRPGPARTKPRPQRLTRGRAGRRGAGGTRGGHAGPLVAPSGRQAAARRPVADPVVGCPPGVGIKVNMRQWWCSQVTWLHQHSCRRNRQPYQLAGQSEIRADICWLLSMCVRTIGEIIF